MRKLKAQCSSEIIEDTGVGYIERQELHSPRQYGSHPVSELIFIRQARKTPFFRTVI